MRLGAAWYPEHWPEEHWTEDVRLMREAGMNVSRIAEFAWSTMEPAEGQFNLDWLERAVSLLADNGIATVLGTPTAAPPAWLTQAHPTTLAVDEYGRRAQHGNRCHYCVNSPIYLDFCRQIVEAMAIRFGQNPHIIGWQLDNEYNRVCYCEECRREFQQFLKKRFDTIENLNQHWSTAYWSEAYNDWRQIPIPIGYHNPGLMLEWRRFITESYRRYQHQQIAILRRYIKPEVWITHNFMGWFDLFDHYEMAADLDLAAWDNYIGTGQLDYTANGAVHDLTRGLKRQNFWLMETQPGHVNWSSINNDLNHGAVRAMAWHAIGHGAEAVLYWQWRSALGGQEQYHGTLIGPDGKPRLLYQEIQQIGQDLSQAGDALSGTSPKAEVAMLHSYPDRWSVMWQKHHRDFDYIQHFIHYYRPLAERNIPVDVISDHASLDDYKLVIAPCLLILDDKLVESLTQFVKGGGHLILTLRTGMKDEYNALLPSRQPGPLSRLAGCRVEEYYALEKEVPLFSIWRDVERGNCSIWAERLEVGDEGHALASYAKSNGWLDNKAAVTMRDERAGRAYYVGTWLDETMQRSFMEFASDEAGVKPVMDSSKGVEVCRRVAEDGRTVYILINHSREPAQLDLPFSATNLFTQKALETPLDLEPNGVAVIAPAASDN